LIISSTQIGIWPTFRRMPIVTDALREILERFDALPDDAVVPSRITATILGLSERTVRYHPGLRRVRLSIGRYGQRVGDIRQLVRGAEAA
jgi:hypothetical protein